MSDATLVDSCPRFIDAPTLARLYWVDYKTCVRGDRPGYLEQPGDIHLRPQYNGDYTLPNFRMCY